MLHPAHLPAAIDLLTSWIDLAEQIQCEPIASGEDRRAYLEVCGAMQKRLFALLRVVAPSAALPHAPAQVIDTSAIRAEDVREAFAHELSHVRSLRVQLMRRDVEFRRAPELSLQDD